METLSGPRRRIVIAVDLLPLKPGGENGGIKPAIFTLLRAVQDVEEEALIFLFLTNTAAHSEVRTLARDQDLLLCVLHDPKHPLPTATTSEFSIIPPPSNLLQTLRVDALYCPFGAATFHTEGIPTVALIADLLHRDYPFTLTSEAVAARELYVSNTIRVATQIQCISRSGMERVATHYEVPPSQLFYTYLPIHHRLTASAQTLASRRSEIAHRPFFFYPANLWLHKNHEVLLLSYVRYKEEACEDAWDLVLTFHEDERAQLLRALVDTLGISRSVQLRGFVSEADLHDIWVTAGALVFPSLHEGFGIPLLEAMHYGVPIITGSEFSLGEVAGDACYRVDPRKPASITAALHAVSQNVDLRETLREQGRQRLALFELKAAAQSLTRVFRNVTRHEEDFPRLPTYSLILPALITPTPHSNELWQIELQCEAKHTGKLTAYLDELPFASFELIPEHNHTFSFSCRPGGRPLAIRAVRRLSDGHVKQDASCALSFTNISAHGPDGQRILLYGEPQWANAS